MPGDIVCVFALVKFLPHGSPQYWCPELALPQHSLEGFGVPSWRVREMT